MFVVYVATNKVNGKRYIGVTGQGLPARKARHVNQAHQGSVRCPRLYAAIRKYGESAFEWKVVASFAFRVLAYHHEFVLVRDWQPEYNACAGGNMAPIPAGRKKPVICLETGKVYESVLAAASAVRGSPSNIAGICRGVATTCRGLHFQYFAAPMTSAQRRDSIALIESIGVARRKRPTIPRERLPRQRNRSGKPVICLDTGVIYGSASRAAESIGVDKGTISRVCRYDRGQKHAKGQHFAFVEDVGQRMFA
jgi:hypothetical protein